MNSLSTQAEGGRREIFFNTSRELLMRVGTI